MAKTPCHDIEGAIEIDAEPAPNGFYLNMFCMSLTTPANREAFKADERAWLNRFPMSEAQKQAVLRRDWTGMLALGGNVYFTAKIAAADERAFQQTADATSGGRCDQGLRSLTETT